jgi:sentrin-specific protease 1
VTAGRALDLKPFAKESMKDWPQQENTADCGMFVAKVAEFFARDAAISFGQADMPYFRKRLIWEIVSTLLISP